MLFRPKHYINIKENVAFPFHKALFSLEEGRSVFRFGRTAVWAGASALSHLFFVLKLRREKEIPLYFLLRQPPPYSATS